MGAVRRSAAATSQAAAVIFLDWFGESRAPSGNPKEEPMTYRLRAVATVVGFAMVLVVAPAASAAPISRCNAAKKKCIGKYVAAVLGCHAKAETKGEAVAAECVAKAVAKVTGGGKGCFDKNDAKTPNDCLHSGDAAQQLADAAALIANVVGAVDPAYPAPTLTKCGAARKKCAAKKASGLLGCSAKLNADGTGDPTCSPKVNDKFSGANGCDPRAVAKGPDCLGSTTTGSLETLVDDWAAGAEFIFDYSGPACGNGVIDAGETCDVAGPHRPEAPCSVSGCNASTCRCECPTHLHFVPDPTSTKTNFDLGWTGLGHRSPTTTNADVTFGVTNCAGTEPPCGQCTLGGPVANVGAGELDNRRCSNDSSIHCTDDAPCVGGTCVYYFGAPMSLAPASYGLCTMSHFNGPIAGTINLESGAMVTTVSATMRVSSGIGTDGPCPQCTGDATPNDAAADGTCTGGARDGLGCDANATTPDRPDWGATSLDCPPIPNGLLATLTVDLSSATSDVVKTLSATSPRCSGDPSATCLCDTCNDLNADACDDNADCPDPPGPIGPICGGRRCLSGPNVGAACTANSACPSSACTRLGEPTKPSACLDDTTTPGVYECADTAPVDGEGECTNGPFDQFCTAPHAQRLCNNDSQCTPGTCVSVARRCYLTGDGANLPGTGTLVANGEADPPVQDVFSPVLGSVFCSQPTNSAAFNNVIGLPGPARWEMNGTATLLP
jgi:hypothetical protein